MSIECLHKSSFPKIDVKILSKKENICCSAHKNTMCYSLAIAMHLFDVCLCRQLKAGARHTDLKETKYVKHLYVTRNNFK